MSIKHTNKIIPFKLRFTSSHAKVTIKEPLSLTAVRKFHMQGLSLTALINISSYSAQRLFSLPRLLFLEVSLFEVFDALYCTYRCFIIIKSVVQGLFKIV